MKHPKPFLFKPQHPEKYAGNPNNIVCRSKLEYYFYRFFDTNPSVLAWGSEEIVIPYFNPLDRRMHRYFPDNILKVKTKDGKEKVIMAEIKPFAFCSPPKPPKRQTQGYINRVEDYVRNQSKWKAAREWCGKKNIEFKILTENDLKRKK